MITALGTDPSAVLGGMSLGGVATIAIGIIIVVFVLRLVIKGVKKLVGVVIVIAVVLVVGGGGLGYLTGVIG